MEVPHYIWFLNSQVAETKIFKKNDGYIQTYSHGAEAHNPIIKPKVFHKQKLSVNFVSPINDDVAVFPNLTHRQLKLTLQWKRSWSTQDHHLYKLLRT